MLDFKVLGIPVRVEPWHWLILFVLGGSSYGLEDQASLLYVLLFMAAGFLSILIHELGHALTGRHFGARQTHIILNGFGGLAVYPDARFSRRQDFLATAAGPGAQILLGLLALPLVPLASAVNGYLGSFFFSLFSISLFWAFLNLLPVLPLDGGRLLANRLGPGRLALTYKIGIGTAAVVGIYAILNGFLFGALFMGFFGYQSFQALRQLRFR